MSIPPLPQQPSQPETLHFNGVSEENHNNQQQSLKNAEKLLSEWSANMKIISHSKFKKVIIMIKGNYTFSYFLNYFCCKYRFS